MTTATASPAKMRDGSWGARVQGTVSVGEAVTIRTKAGKTWTARVTRVVWTGQGVSICATQSLDRPASAAPARTRSYSRTNRWGQHRCVECGETSGLGTGCTSDPSRCFDCDS